MVHIDGRRPGFNAVPVRIAYIIRNRDETVQLAVHSLMPADQSSPNPFQHFPHFHAETYSPRFTAELAIVKLEWVEAHFALYEMSPDYAAVLNLSRVSQYVPCIASR